MTGMKMATSTYALLPSLLLLAMMQTLTIASAEEDGHRKHKSHHGKDDHDKHGHHGHHEDHQDHEDHDNIGKHVNKLPNKVLLFSGTGWYRHPEIPAINGFLVRLGHEHGIQVDVTETPRDVERFLKNYKVLILNNCNMLDKLFTQKQRHIIETWYEQGGGIVSLHAAMVKQQKWPWLHDLNGCDFNSDSEFVKARVLVDPKAADHPILKGRPADGEDALSFWYTSDWTNHDVSVTGLKGVQVLLRVDESSFQVVRPFFQARGGKPMGKDHPVVWTRAYQGGRLFYTDLGHSVPCLDTPFGRQHLIEGIRWVAAVAK